MSVGAFVTEALGHKYRGKPKVGHSITTWLTRAEESRMAISHLWALPRAPPITLVLVIDHWLTLSLLLTRPSHLSHRGCPKQYHFIFIGFSLSRYFSHPYLLSSLYSVATCVNSQCDEHTSHISPKSVVPNLGLWVHFKTLMKLWAFLLKNTYLCGYTQNFQ